MHLYQACGKVSDSSRERMTIILDGSKFKFGSAEYVDNQNKELDTYDFKEDILNNSFTLIASTLKR